MWSLLIEAGIWVGLYLINRYVFKSDDKKSYTHNKLELPRADEGVPMPMLFGTARIDSPILAYASSLSVKDDYPNAGDVSYAMDLFFVLAMPMAYDPTDQVTPTLFSMWVDDRKTAWAQQDIPDAISTINVPLTGGKWSFKISSPLMGRISFYDGYKMAGQPLGSEFLGPGTTARIPQVLNNNNAIGTTYTLIADSAAMTGVDANGETVDMSVWPNYLNFLSVALTGYRNSHDDIGALTGYPSNPTVPQATPGSQVDEFLKKLTLGTSAQLPSVGFEAQSLGPGLISTPGAFGFDADPMEVLCDIITNKWGKLGRPIGIIDVSNFANCSATLLAEGHGYSRVIYDRSDASQVLADVLKQIDGSMYIEPTTGQFRVKLIRQDYSVGALLHFTTQHIIEVTDYGLGAWRETYNKVEVTFTNRANNYKDGTAFAIATANAVGQDGALRLQQLAYPGITNGDLAAKVAARELNIMAQPLAKITLVVDRRAIDMRPGDPFFVIYPEYGINTVFRVTDINFGQLFDNKITIHAIQDAWDNAYTGHQSTGTFFLPTPYPPRERFATEAPYYLQRAAYQAGAITNPDLQREFAYAVPDYLDGGIKWDSKLVHPIFGLDQFWGGDVPRSSPSRALTVNPIARETEPYDTTTGIVIDTCTGPLFSLYNFTTIAGSSSNVQNTMIVVVDAAGNSEIMGYETATALGGGQYRLNHVWRGLLDTPARAFDASSRVYFIRPNECIGHQSMPTVGYGWKTRPVPQGSLFDGSGDDPITAFTVRARAFLEGPVTNFGIAGAGIVGGVAGAPATILDGLTYYKSFQYLEEGMSFYLVQNERVKWPVVNGANGANYVNLAAGVSQRIQFRKLDGDINYTNAAAYNQRFPLEKWHDPESLNGEDYTGFDTSSGGALLACGLRIGNLGHGNFEGTSLIGLGIDGDGSGIFPAAPGRAGYTAYNWDSPRVKFNAPRWRNLLSNVRFDMVQLHPSWVTIAGNPTFTSSASSLRNPSVDLFFVGGAGATPCTILQSVDVTGFLPRGLNSILTFYYRNMNADANDTVTATIEYYNGGLFISSVSSGALIGSTTAWTKIDVSGGQIPALTTKILVRFVLAGVGDTQPDTAVADVSLRIGQLVRGNLLNADFAAGTFTSWTNVTNSFVASTIKLQGTRAAQGGAFATSEIRQDWTIGPTTEYTFATAVLLFSRANAIAGDLGNVTMEFYDGASTLLGTKSTGFEAIPTGSGFVRRVLAMDIPVGAVTIRTRLQAARAAGAGNSGAVFADFDLQVHKYLEPNDARVYTFDNVTAQQTPTDWQQHYLAFTQIPAPAPTVYNGEGLPSDLTWTDGAANHKVGKAVGWWGGSTGMSISAYEIARASGTSAPHIVAQGTAATTLGAYGSSLSFSVGMFFKIDEPVFTVACGLIGRHDGTLGWSLGLDATGHVTAELKGASGTKTVTAATTCHDGAWHMAWISYDAVAQTLTVYDERGVGASVSTASGLGEFYSPTALLRIGRSKVSIDTMPGMIARVFLASDPINAPYSAAQIASHWNYLKDTTGTLGNNRRTVPVWCEGVPDGAGATLVCVAPDQYPAAYRASLVAVNSTGIGLPIGPATTNVIPTNDLSTMTLDAGASRVLGVQDPTGKRSGVTFNVDPTNGAIMSAIPMTAATKGQLVIWIRNSTLVAGGGINIELQNSAGVVKQTLFTGVMNGTWTKTVMPFTLWDGSTATAKLRFYSASGIPLAFDLCHVMWMAQGVSTTQCEVPPYYQFAAKTTTQGYFQQTNNLLEQCNHEGEIIAIGVSDNATPVNSGGIAGMYNNITAANYRRLSYTAAAAPMLDHMDATPTDVTSTGTAIDWTQVWTIRGRWCANKMLDNVVNPYAGIIVVGSVGSTVYGRTAVFTTSTVLNKSYIGDPNTGSIACAVLQSVAFRSREQKLV